MHIHIINSLGSGGAENVLCRIASTTTSDNHVIYVLKNDLFLCERYQVDATYIFSSLNDFLIFIRSLKSAISINSWLYLSNIFTFILCAILRLNYKHIFHLRNTDLTFDNNGFKTGLLGRVVCVLSYFVKKSIFNSFYAYRNHKAFLYSDKHAVVGNVIQGFNFTSHEKKYIFGYISRYHRVKNHEFLLKGLSSWASNNKQPCILYLVGKGVARFSNSSTKYMKVIAVEQTNNVQDYYRLIDCHVSVSKGESFPNTIVEAGISGCFNIYSDVGDTSLILSESTSCSFNSGSFSGFIAALEYYKKQEFPVNELKLESERLLAKYSFSNVYKSFSGYLNGT